MPDFDWVTEYARCSIGALFEKLKLQLQEDVDKRQELRGSGPSYKFVLLHNSEKATVLIEGNNVHESVVFRLSGRAIEVVDDEGNVRFTATPTLNDEGECRLKINGEEKELWHLRKMALEELFFRRS